ncbi:hypothetical protein AAF712_015767 [Marasmius tenuissimus]|uniref:Uncharacterized protein n=1 Tax=Marasmius tenuissimus TaxID=585030 RepID=A0ABR2Z9L9_9AGAR
MPEPDPLFVSSKDEFGLFTVYQFGLPSRNPDKDIAMDDLVDSGGFAVNPIRGHRPGAVFGTQKVNTPSSALIAMSTENIAMTDCPETTDTPTSDENEEKSANLPFLNPTSFCPMDWYYNTAANGHSMFNFNKLVAIFCHPDYNPSHIAKFDCVKEGKKMDAYIGGEIPKGKGKGKDKPIAVEAASGEEIPAAEKSLATGLPFTSYSGWNEGFVDIPLPRAGHKCTEHETYKFRVDDIWYQSALSAIQDDFQDTLFYSFHLKLFKQFWQPEPDSLIQRVYSEVYTSDRMLEMKQDVLQRVPADCNHEVVVVAIMQYSDSTNLMHFGDWSIWPGYISFGNMSKYRWSNPSMFAMNHIVYVPKIPDSFKQTYKDLLECAVTDEVLRFVKREMIQLVWALILSDPNFVDVYLNGKLEQCADGVLRLLFPRLFTCSTDYVEK